MLPVMAERELVKEKSGGLAVLLWLPLLIVLEVPCSCAPVATARHSSHSAEGSMSRLGRCVDGLAGDSGQRTAGA
jgi:hypothetical protein